MRKVILIVSLLCLYAALASAQTVRHSGGLVPSGKGYGVPGEPQVERFSVHQGNGINYHGGPIMSGTPNVYLIWYGNWISGPAPSDSLTTVNLVTNFFKNVSGSGYEMINSTYGDNSNDVTGLVNVAGSAKATNYPMGKNLSDAAIQQIVSKVISLGKLPKDTNGVYFVLTTSDVNATSGFCSVYCGWHTHGTISGSDIKYSFVGNPDRCASSCEPQTKSPNNDSGADGMINIAAHELEEAISDPDLNAWWDNVGQENADKCAWKFGTLLGGTIGNGGYNETMNGVNYLIQMNWENARGGGCDNFLGGPFHNN
ncbi:MAG TPA: hypothetical protein VH437_07670 [Terriglobales bacterium]|jgi:hypothetical protein